MRAEDASCLRNADARSFEEDLLISGRFVSAVFESTFYHTASSSVGREVQKRCFFCAFFQAGITA
ncbi:MAG: hypothetical protein DBX46_03350 [Clostridiales bacterium]|nr:MAG: hypothetical protein DBX46_03350 [Clostridiales bacterium]